MEEQTKEEQQTKEEHKKPNYKGSLEVSGWLKKDKNGNEFISLKISQYCNLFNVSK